jgi:phosphate transport system substrate-binding protein
MIVSKKRNGLVAVLAVALLLVGVSSFFVAGCGNGGDLPSAGGADTTAATATPTTTGTDTTAGATDATQAPLSASLNGAGATFPEPLYIEWIGEFQMANPDVTINYQGIGSGGGIEQFTKLTVDFGASDAPMKDEELAAAEVAGGAQVMHIPTVFGAVVLAYNLEGVDELRLDPDTLAAIFLGNVTKWDDPAIAALNPGVTLPDQAIQVVHRSDSSGTTNIFTGYLAQVSTEWADSVGKGKEVTWPTGVGGNGNNGVAAVVQQQSGSVGYVELSYATESGLAMATLKNKSGNFVTPSLESTSAAAVGVTFPEDLRFSVSNSDGAQAYPIVGATWILVFDKMNDAAKVQALKAWLTWSLNEGTSIAEELGYAPLSEELKALAQAKIDSISTF